jgi:acetyl-CoA carboxylase biotin carboxyl carrier protein
VDLRAGAGVSTSQAIRPAAAPADPAKPAPAPKTSAPATAPAPAPTPAAPPDAPTINAPLNGTFYATPGPGQPAFVKAGDTVKAGDPVCVVEAMKLFNKIQAPDNCKILKCLVEHGKPVKKDQPLFAIQKSA